MPIFPDVQRQVNEKRCWLALRRGVVRLAATHRGFSPGEAAATRGRAASACLLQGLSEGQHGDRAASAERFQHQIKSSLTLSPGGSDRRIGEEEERPQEAVRSAVTRSAPPAGRSINFAKRAAEKAGARAPAARARAGTTGAVLGGGRRRGGGGAESGDGAERKSAAASPLGGALQGDPGWAAAVADGETPCATASGAEREGAEVGAETGGGGEAEAEAEAGVAVEAIRAVQAQAITTDQVAALKAQQENLSDLLAQVTSALRPLLFPAAAQPAPPSGRGKSLAGEHQRARAQLLAMSRSPGADGSPAQRPAYVSAMSRAAKIASLKTAMLQRHQYASTRGLKN